MAWRTGCRLETRLGELSTHRGASLIYSDLAWVSEVYEGRDREQCTLLKISSLLSFEFQKNA